MIDEKEMIEVTKKKVDYFYKNKVIIHISLKADKFLNGEIKKVEKDFFILEDFKEGSQPVFYEEILPNGITKYMEKKDAGKN